MNGEYVTIQTKAILFCFKALSRRFEEKLKKNTENQYNSRDLNPVFPGIIKLVTIRQFDVREMRERPPR